MSAVYGLSFAEINAMPMATIGAYIQHIPKILAMWHIVTGEGALLPYMKNPSKMLRRWVKEAFGTEATKTKATPGMLKLIGIGVKHV